jgi:putative protein-disulfide isomerase
MPHHFLYVADPMCSWCYGFAPVIEAIATHFEGRLPVKVMVGGLRAGNTQAMRQQDKDFIRGAWGKVGPATGRSFDMRFFEREGFIYDTEPACRAVVTARHLAPEKVLGLKGRISEAFYGNNRDTTNTEELAAIARKAGFDEMAFRSAFLSPEVRNDTFRDFLTAKHMGVEGFPCLLLGGNDGQYALVSNGYRPLDGMIEGIERWLAAQGAQDT